MATQVEVDDNGNEFPLRVTGEILADAVIEAVSSGITMLNNINGEVITGNLMDKLKAVLSTKEGIADAIKAFGVSIPENATFAQYPQFIAEILTVITGSLMLDLNFFADRLSNIVGNDEQLGGQI